MSTDRLAKDTRVASKISAATLRACARPHRNANNIAIPISNQSISLFICSYINMKLTLSFRDVVIAQINSRGTAFRFEHDFSKMNTPRPVLEVLLIFIFGYSTNEGGVSIL